MPPTNTNQRLLPVLVASGFLSATGVTGGNLTGSLSVLATSIGLKLGSGSLTGTKDNTFPGLPSEDNMAINVTLGGACPASLLFKPARMMPDGQSFGANVTG
jgi:hypothetical protein